VTMSEHTAQVRSRITCDTDAMGIDEVLGRRTRLPVRRFGPPGAFLAHGDDEASVVLLPRAEVPEGAREGEELEVFVYLDSDDRPIATTATPHIAIDEVAFLRVSDITRFGAFVSWGLPKELLVPFAEQTRDLTVGERYAIGLYVDSSGRLAGTMRVSEMLRSTGEFTEDEWVAGEAWRQEPGIGTFIIVEKAFVGLVPAEEPNALTRGDKARFRITNVLRDGKIELSLRGHAHQELEGDAERVRSALARPGAPKVGDRSSPEAIRAAFGLSKKAFKRAAGALLKQGLVAIDPGGFFVAVAKR
jgi:predicted RNA-binding protein (virulence factor B family)